MSATSLFMTKSGLKKLSIIGLVIIILLCIMLRSSYEKHFALTELYRTVSPDENYTLIIYRVGEKDLIGVDTFEVEMFSNNPSIEYHSSFQASVAVKVSAGVFCVEWLDIGAQVTLGSNRQLKESYILPFDQNQF